MDVSIREAQPAELDAVRALIEEYVRSLGIDLSFQEIDAELADLASAYGPPGGCILVALSQARRWRGASHYGRSRIGSAR